MKKNLRLMIVFCVLCPFISAQDDAPNVQRQIVFGISPFDGVKYLASFLPEAQKEMFLTADTNNTVSVLLSDVYYWPITAEYRADFQGVHIPLVGKLSVFKGKELYRELEQVEYIYVYPRGPTGEASILLAGEEMIRFMEEVRDSFEERMANPYLAWPTFQGPFKGFVVNLPEGKYRLAFSVENEGRVFSIEKNLKVFAPIKTGAAYQIIPDEKWTVSSNSETTQQRIYLKPDTVIYLKLFPTLLYSKADFERMAAPHRPSSGMGLENSSIWVHEEISLEEDDRNSLIIGAAGQTSQIRPREFLVRQTEGSALGYTILEYDPEQFPNTRPPFSAYRLTAPPPGVGVTLRVTSEGTGNSIGKENQALRHLRSLEPRVLELTLLAFIFPMILILLRLGAGYIERRRIK